MIRMVMFSLAQWNSEILWYNDEAICLTYPSLKIEDGLLWGAQDSTGNLEKKTNKKNQGRNNDIAEKVNYQSKRYINTHQ